MPLRNVSTPTQIKNPNNSRNRTGTHLSTNIFIAIDDLPVAAIQQMTINEAREIQSIPEVGTDGIIDSAPKASATIDGTCKRTRFDGKRACEAFRRSFLHIKSQRTPFDIQIYDLFQGDADQQIITTIENIWLKSLSYSYSASDFVIVDDMGWKAEDIFSVRNEAAQSAITDPRTVFVNDFEVEADVGLYRGALDAAGLLNAFDGSNL